MSESHGADADPLRPDGARPPVVLKPPLEAEAAEPPAAEDAPRASQRLRRSPFQRLKRETRVGLAILVSFLILIGLFVADRFRRLHSTTKTPTRLAAQAETGTDTSGKTGALSGSAKSAEPAPRLQVSGPPAKLGEPAKAVETAVLEPDEAEPAEVAAAAIQIQNQEKTAQARTLAQGKHSVDPAESVPAPTELPPSVDPDSALPPPVLPAPTPADEGSPIALEAASVPPPADTMSPDPVSSPSRTDRPSTRSLPTPESEDLPPLVGTARSQQPGAPQVDRTPQVQEAPLVDFPNSLPPPAAEVNPPDRSSPSGPLGANPRHEPDRPIPPLAPAPTSASGLDPSTVSPMPEPAPPTLPDAGTDPPHMARSPSVEPASPSAMIPLPNAGRVPLVVEKPIGGPARRTVVPAPPSRSQAAPVAVKPSGRQIDPIEHVVQPGESFASLSRLYYGSERYQQALARANKAQAGSRSALAEGSVVRIPPPEALDPSLVSAADPPPSVTARRDVNTERAGRSARVEGYVSLPTSRPASSKAESIPIAVEEPRRYHVVKDHETLRSIARDTLGDPHRADEILNLNRELLDDSSALEPGLRLRLPRDAQTRQLRR